MWSLYIVGVVYQDKESPTYPASSSEKIDNGVEKSSYKHTVQE